MKTPSSRVSLAILLVAILALLSPGTALFADDRETGFTGSTRDYGKTTQVGDPLSAGNGAYFFSKPLLSLGGPMGLGFELFYRSDYGRFNSYLPGLGFWWRPFADAILNFPTSDTDPTKHATVYLPDGDQVSFKKDTSGNWVLTGATVDDYGFLYRDNIPRTKYQLKETTNFAYLMDPIGQRAYLFQQYEVTQSGERHLRPARILDRNGNQLSYSYATSTDNRPTRIEDGLGRSLDLTYASVGGQTFLSTLTDQGGRRVTINYQAQGSDNDNQPTLRSITDPMNQTTTFGYAGAVNFFNGLIASQTLPRGNVPYTQSYQSKTLAGNDFPRVVSQRDAPGNSTTFAYSSGSNLVTETRPDGSTRAYEHYSTHGLPKSLTDPAGKSASLGRNSEEQLTSVTDRLGSTTGFSYHSATGKLASFTNARGGVTSFSFTAQNQSFTNPLNSEQVTFTFYNLTRGDYPDGSNEQLAYDANGNLTQATDRGGQVWQYQYNSRGQVTRITNPTGGVTDFTYNSSDATLASRDDSDTGATTFTYDSLKRPTRLTHPDGAFAEVAYNANDRITRLTDERGNITNYSYDANDNLTGVTDPAGKSTSFTYDAMDRVVQVTDRLGKTTTYTYDSLGRLASATDPTGVATTFSYDSRGWLKQVTRAGKSWQRGYDDEGIATSDTTPLGYATSYQSDALGFRTRVTNPLNQSTTLARDAMSRLTGVTDPLSRTTGYSYDARGLLAGVTEPVVGTATYQRDGLGSLTRITDLNGQNWGFTRTGMGRLQSATDPLSRATSNSYDTLGRISGTTFPGGATLTRSYDAAGNLTRLQYSDGTDLQLGYDSLNRLTSANNLALAYDAGGRVATTQDGAISFGATYDDAGRLKSASYNNGAFAVTYSYSTTTGLLTRVADGLTGSQVDFSYDDDFRLTGIARSNGVNATLGYDNAGRLTRLQDGTLLDLQHTLDAAGQVTGLTMTAPLDPGEALGSGTDSFTVDAASQISSPGYSYDQRGRQTAAPGRSYSWDGASRLTGAGSATLAYNGLRDVRTRAEGGATTHYYYNYGLGLTPPVAERDEAGGQFLRYYVWTPDGRLLYMIDAADGNKVYFYHFDRTGSTLALTNASGAVTDAYAYTPYGKLLGRQGTNPQPFTFVGRYGVRQEGSSGTLYQMRARYYDAATGRFLSRDPLWPNTADPLQINPYQYGTGEPIGVLDVTGLGALLNDFWKFDFEPNDWTEARDQRPANVPHSSSPPTMDDLWEFNKDNSEFVKNVPSSSSTTASQAQSKQYGGPGELNDLWKLNEDNSDWEKDDVLRETVNKVRDKVVTKPPETKPRKKPRIKQGGVEIEIEPEVARAFMLALFFPLQYQEESDLEDRIDELEKDLRKASGYVDPAYADWISKQIEQAEQRLRGLRELQELRN